MPRNIKTEPIDAAIARVLNGEYHRFPGMTRAKIADASGIPVTTVQRLFTGQSAWSASQFLAVVAAIGTDRTPEVLFREAIALSEKLSSEDAVSEAPSNVTHINQKGDKREFEWQGEQHAMEEWDAVAKSSESTIEIDPETHTP